MLERSFQMTSSHYVTCYYQDGIEIKSKALSKSDVLSFVEKHQDSPCIIVCDPLERVNTIYEYGRIPKQAS